MKAFQDRCVANKGVIWRFRKRQEIKNKERDLYKEAVRTLNMELMEKLALLKEETHHHEKAEKAKTNLITELAALCEQMDMAKVNAMAAFRVSQPFLDECGVFYGDKFEDYLKQFEAVYPNLDLSQIVIDDIVSPTLGGNDVVSDKINKSAHTVG